MTTEYVNDTGKWLLSFGIHRGTLTSRDSEQTRHGSEAEARRQYQESKKAYADLGMQVWYAKMIQPGAPYSTGWIVLDSGTPYS